MTKRLKDYSSRTPGTPQESATNSVVSAALLQYRTLTTPTTLPLIRQWFLVEDSRDSSLISCS